MLMIAFFEESNFGIGIYELPRSGFYFTVCTSRLIIELKIH